MWKETKMHSITIIVPTLNEAENIDPLLQRIFAIRELQNYDLDVLFSDGASIDTTCERILRWQDTHPVSLVCRKENIGLGNAVLSAANKTNSDFIVVMDADLSHPPEMIPVLLNPLLLETCEMTIGSRYCKGGCTPDWPTQRRIMSKLASIPARFLTKVHDPLSGFFAIKREKFALLAGEVHGFKVALELLVVCGNDLVVREIPIVFHDRHYGYSKLNLKIVASYLRQLGVLLQHKVRTRIKS